jgi:hypothetical protein
MKTTIDLTPIPQHRDETTRFDVVGALAGSWRGRLTDDHGAAESFNLERESLDHYVPGQVFLFTTPTGIVAGTRLLEAGERSFVALIGPYFDPAEGDDRRDCSRGDRRAGAAHGRVPHAPVQLARHASQRTIHRDSRRADLASCVKLGHRVPTRWGSGCGRLWWPHPLIFSAPKPELSPPKTADDVPASPASRRCRRHRRWTRWLCGRDSRGSARIEHHLRRIGSDTWRDVRQCRLHPVESTAPVFGAVRVRATAFT